MNWLKQQAANIAGTAEPEYGASAIQPVSAQSAAGPAYTELTKEHLKWQAPHYTAVETQCFYIFGEDGRFYMCQLIYSNIAGIRTTCQFNTKVFDYDGPGKHQWTSDPLSNHSFKKDPYSFHADNVAADLSADGNSYTIKAHTNKACAVDIKFERTAPGFVAGKDGKTLYGTDQKNPWGSMYHAFWPRAKVTGTFKTGRGEINVAGLGSFIHALQGMKPHHAAARWNFASFQSPTSSAIMMEFTTPRSYGTTTVNVGGVVVDGKLVYAGTNNKATHVTAKQDPEVRWPEPGEVKFEWDAQPTAESSAGSISTDLHRSDRVDVMAEVPGFVKQIVSSAAGTRPYIYQYVEKPSFHYRNGTDTAQESGLMFMEATFIS